MLAKYNFITILGPILLSSILLCSCNSNIEPEIKTGGTTECDLLSDAFLNSFLKEVVAPYDGLVDELDPVELSECVYKSSSGDEATTDFYYIAVGILPSGGISDAQSVFPGIPVAEIGDEAYFDNIGRIYVKEGDVEFKIVIRNSWSAMVNDEQELAALKLIAVEVISNL